MPLALIDVGSNTIRLSIYAVGEEAGPGHAFARLFSKKVMAGLAGYVDDSGALSREGVDRACDALCYLRSILENLHIAETHVFATASLRNVTNSAEALRAIDERTGFDVELVSSEQEALLGYSSFQHDCKTESGVLVDIGGGSTEVTTFEENRPKKVASMPLGSLKLFKRNVEKILPSRKERGKIRRQVERALDDAGFRSPEPYDLLCGIGGTCRAACKLVNRLYKRPQNERTFTFAELADLMGALEDSYPAARQLILRACPDRIHTIVPGLIVLCAVAERFDIESVKVSQYGVREGYLFERILCKEQMLFNAP